MIVQDVLKKTGIITAHPDDTLGSAVSKLHSSHDAAFIFDDSNTFMGVINPYHCLFKNTRKQGESLVKNCLYHPPKLQLDDDLSRVVALMRDSRMHYLPVMDSKGVFLGTVSARRILREAIADPVYQISVQEALQQKGRPLVSVYGDDMVSKIKNLFDEEHVSKLVVINREMKLEGILSYYDLIPHMIAPVEKEEADFIRIDNEDEFAHLKVETVMQHRVHTRKPDDTVEQIAQDIIKREIGCVVIMNRQGFPVGIITIRDLLLRLTADEPSQFIDLSTNDVSEANMKILMDYGPKLERWVSKMRDVRRAHMLVKEEKNGGLFKVSLSVTPVKGKTIVYTEEDKTLLKVLQKINKNN